MTRTETKPIASATTRTTPTRGARRLALAPAWVLVTIVVILLPMLGLSSHMVDELIQIGIIALVVSGINLTFGYAGELTLGAPATYAAGAYLAGYASVHWINDGIVVLLISVAAALVLGLLVGIPGLRLGGWMLAIASVFLVFLIPYVLTISPDKTGGFNGMTGIPQMSIFGMPLSSTGFFAVVIVVASLWFALFRNVVRSPYGRAFLVLKESPVLARSLGLSVYQMKLRAYALGAVPAGLAGGLYAYWGGFIVPTYFDFNLLVLLLAASLVGGSASVFGAVVGAAVLELANKQFETLGDFSTVIFGSLLVGFGVLLPYGLVGLATRLIARYRRARRKQDEEISISTSGEKLDTVELPHVQGGALRLDSVKRSFGGVAALDGVSMTMEPGRITALIGPNGSGKTTCLNVICGFYKPDSGSIRLDDDELTARPAHVIVRNGIARTFQTPIIPDALSVRDVVESGRITRDFAGITSTVLRLPRWWRMQRANRVSSDLILGALGLLRHADVVASDLPLGTRRLLELGRAMAAEPRVILLDEVASGLDEDELNELIAVVRRLRETGATVVLVEHNFALVREVADHVVVLAEGRVIAEGTSDYIAGHPKVVEHYLGEVEPA